MNTKFWFDKNNHVCKMRTTLREMCEILNDNRDMAIEFCNSLDEDECSYHVDIYWVVIIPDPISDGDAPYALCNHINGGVHLSVELLDVNSNEEDVNELVWMICHMDGSPFKDEHTLVTFEFIERR